MTIIARVSEGGQMNLPAETRRQVRLEHGGPIPVAVVGGKIRMRAMRQALVDLQDEAGRVFAGSDEGVGRFLEERRTEAQPESGARG